MSAADLLKLDLPGMIEAAYRDGLNDGEQSAFGRCWEDSCARCDAEFVREKMKEPGNA